ncbi:hypothetical protein NDU88_005740 [Pleurodeles waltl]|uniref:Uncharacterized protein n=1 Tax=Pleurodeles waltl TaxID=8319 RepID=A0AAV7TC99_PLEWA|nr:hypothetical protein NDU88_005740 [Pleurodeles waltl]
MIAKSVVGQPRRRPPGIELCGNTGPAAGYGEGKTHPVQIWSKSLCRGQCWQPVRGNACQEDIRGPEPCDRARVHLALIAARGDRSKRLHRGETGPISLSCGTSKPGMTEEKSPLGDDRA